ncbi:MAG: hypothetical protein KC419_24900, partial [Anaerolineales bacterium]|nr:hypothetical protein [Anaerolineales bacterium]
MVTNSICDKTVLKSAQIYPNSEARFPDTTVFTTFGYTIVMQLTPTQQTAVSAPNISFWLGPAGSGKTTALRERLLALLESGEPAYTILVLVAEPDQQRPFLDFLHQSGLGPYADLKVTTYNKMAQEMVQLFW